MTRLPGYGASVHLHTLDEHMASHRNTYARAADSSWQCDWTLLWTSVSRFYVVAGIVKYGQRKTLALSILRRWPIRWIQTVLAIVIVIALAVVLVKVFVIIIVIVLVLVIVTIILKLVRKY